MRRGLMLTAAVTIAFAGRCDAACVGDCGNDGEVTVNELITMVNVALGTTAVSECLAGETDGDGAISVNEIIMGVNNALNGCAARPTPTATATPGGTASYVGDYSGTDSSGVTAVRFSVEASGSAHGFFDFLTPDTTSLAAGEGRGAGIAISYAVDGQANLSTGTYQISGSVPGGTATITGQLPNGAAASGTFSASIFGMTYQGSLTAGAAPPTATPTPSPACDSADLHMTFSNVSSNFNGNASSFVIERMLTAHEQPAPSFIPGLHEVYNSIFNGTECVQQGQRLRNIQVSLFEVPGGLAGGQSFPISSGSIGEAGALVYYGEEGSGGDRVWSGTTGTVFIDSVSGSFVAMRIVGAAMTETAGAATGSFTLDVSGHVNTFTGSLTL